MAIRKVEDYKEMAMEFCKRKGETRLSVLAKRTQP